jgi:AhpD family alkylhydroperoxidase
VGCNKDLLKEMHEATRDLRSRIGGVYDGFGEVYRNVYVDGALSAGMKELVAVAIAVHSGCDGCIASHARSAVRKGVTPDEVAEAIGVAIQMGGGPASIYGPRAWAAFQEFSEDQR